MKEQVMATDDFLAHYGVKGMKWGVRSQKRLDRLNRVASGTASRREKTQVMLTETSEVSRIRNKGLEGAAKTRADQLKARKERIQKGEGTVRDLLALHGGDRIFIVKKG